MEAACEYQESVFYHDKARPHTVNEFNLKLLPHPAYSPEIAQSNSHSFCILRNFSKEKGFNSKQDVQNGLSSSFFIKTKVFRKQCKKMLRVR